uniref:Uncharacterized protein n=1 Tax=Anguilla anguilla TaxID=7936 RepID=A0A0E9W9J4_ANGAN
MTVRHYGISNLGAKLAKPFANANCCTSPWSKMQNDEEHAGVVSSENLMFITMRKGETNLEHSAVRQASLCRSRCVVS